MSTVIKYPYQPLPEHREIKRIHYLGKTYISEEIINELEKYLEKIIVDSKAGSSMYYNYLDIYKYLKELKEKNNDI